MPFNWIIRVVDASLPGEILHEDRGNGLYGEDCYWEAVCAVEDWFSAWAEEVCDGRSPETISIAIVLSHEGKPEPEVATTITLERLHSRDPYPDLPGGNGGRRSGPGGCTT